MADMLGIDRRINKENAKYKMIQNGIIPSAYKEYENLIDNNLQLGLPIRLLQLYGKVPHKEKGVFTDEYSKMYDKSRYRFLLGADFRISNKCCYSMKKEPLKSYAKRTKRHPITAQMASESKLRTSNWMKHGCNAFESKEPISNPMSFWTEQDVLTYIKKNNLPICSVYGEVVEDRSGTDEVEGQMTMSDCFEDAELFDSKRLPLKTTGCDRTGCVLCGFGCHLEKEGEERFLRLKETHPKFHNLLFLAKNNGITYAEAIDWINENGNLKNKIKY